MEQHLSSSLACQALPMMANALHAVYLCTSAIQMCRQMPSIVTATWLIHLKFDILENTKHKFAFNWFPVLPVFYAKLNSLYSGSSVFNKIIS